MSTAIARDASPEQMKQVERLLEDTLRDAAVGKLVKQLGLSSRGAQRVIEQGNKFSARVREAVYAAIEHLSVTDAERYRNDVVSSDMVYPAGFKINPIKVQLGILQKCLGVELKIASRFWGNCPPLHHYDEGHLVLPKLRVFDSDYFDALRTVLGALSKQREFDWPDDLIFDQGHLQCLEETSRSIQKFEDEQNDGDVIVVPAGLGLRHRGRSVCLARGVMADTPGEFPLDPLSVAVGILTNPDRFRTSNDLCIDCAGARYNIPEDGGWPNVLTFSMSKQGVLLLGTASDEVPDREFGSASGFAHF